MPGRYGRLLTAAAFTAFAACAPFVVRAQSDDPPTFVKNYAFSFDFSAPPNEAAELQEVQLHYSIDRGQSWKLYRGVPPSDGKITFEAAGDGEYWFAVQQVYKDGRRKPARMEGVAPQRRVVVDTTPPRVDLRPVSGGGKVGVEWSIRSENADLNSIRLESRLTGRRDWSQVSISPTRSGRKTWDSEGKGDYEVRLRVVDRAGNESLPNVFVSASRLEGRLAADDDSFSEPAPPHIGDSVASGKKTAGRGAGRLVAESNAPAMPLKPNGPLPTGTVPTFYVNKLRFKVNYKVDAVGKSGCKAVQLFWRYPDQDEWTDYGPNVEKEPPFKVAVTGEGKYGIRLRAVSGVGLGEDIPAAGAPPQLWVVVDVTPPTVQLDAPKVRFGEPSEVLISWHASDDNPAENKVRLSYAAADGPDAGRWKEIAKALKYEGKYRWKPPADAPYRFNVRIDAEDAAGNAAHDETTDPVSIDDSRPRAVATAVEVSGDNDPPARNATAKDADGPEPSRARTAPSLDVEELTPGFEMGKKLGPKGTGGGSGPTPPRPLPH